MNSIPVAVQENYPEIKIKKKDLILAYQLSQPLAGAKSEMTATYQYLYQHWLLEEQGNDFAKILWRISLVEMKHLEILGQLILALGGDPRCWAVENRQSTYWQGSFPNYSQELLAMLRVNLQDEEDAARNYRELARQIDHPKIAELLQQFAADEDLHAWIFRDYLQQLLD